MNDVIDDLTWLRAHEEIRQLAARYALAVESRDIDALVALFVGDVQVGRDERGHAALRASFDAQLRGVGVTVLHVAGHVIDLADAEHATGIVSCRGEVQDGHRWIVQAIQYHDTYERRGDRWLFVRRRHLLFYGADAPASPLDQPPAHWPASHTGTGDLPERWESWRAFWTR